MSYVPARPVDLSPVKLNYVGALRGLKPHSMETSTSYALLGSFDPDSLIQMAASNPHGQFYGVLANEADASRATDIAALRKISNVRFVSSPDKVPSDLQYLCFENDTNVLSQQQRDELFDLAQTKLAAGGLFAFRYKAYDNPDQILQFLIAEYAPEVTPDKALAFMLDLKALGASYFSEHPIALAALDKAITSRDHASFFDACEKKDGAALSGAFEALAGLLPRDFSFVGEADIAANYLELVAPVASHSVLEKCRDHLLYEPIKDFVLQRLVRNDVWVKRPVEQTFDDAELYGQFTFGITLPEERVPAMVKTQSGDIALTSVLFKRLISLMTTLPLGVGDFLHHPAGQGMKPEDVIASINVLIACGIAQPMRSRYEGTSPSKVTRHVWSTPYNEYLNLAEITEPTVVLASPVIGAALSIPARDALVLQAITRVGLVHCAAALQPELQRILQKNPALAAQIMDAAEATDEVVHNIVTNVVSNNMGRWFAYGLLAA